VSSAAENSNKFQKNPSFGREKSVEGMVNTWGQRHKPHTSLLFKSILRQKKKNYGNSNIFHHANIFKQG
jgi:hypothetical protein